MLYSLIIHSKRIYSLANDGLIQIITNNYPPGLLIVFYTYTFAVSNLTINLNDLLIELERKNSFVIVNKHMNLTLDLRPVGYIFFIFEEQDLVDIFEKVIQKSNVFTPRCSYLIYLADINNDYDKYFGFLRKHHVYNTHLFMGDKYVSMERKINNCREFWYVISEVSDDMKLSNTINWNMYQCPINVLTRSWPPNILEATYHDPKTHLTKFSDGVEIRVLEILAEKINFTLNFYSNLTGLPYDYHKDLANNPDKYDLLALSIVPRLDYHAIFDFTNSYMADDVRWNCPRNTIQGWKILLHNFRIYIWLSVVIYFIIIMSLIYCLHKEANVFSITLLIHLGYPIPTQKFITGGIRFFFLICSFYGFIIACSYQTGVISLMAKTQWAIQPNTIREIIEDTDLKTGWLNSIPNYISNPDETWAYLLEHTIPFGDVEVGMNRTVTARDMCMLCNNLKLQYLTPSYYLDASGNALYYQLDDKLMTYNVEMLLTRHHYLLQPFNEYLGRIGNSGLIFQWLKDLRSFQKLKSGGSKLFVISLNHIKGPIVVYMAGQMVALLVMFGEMFWCRFKMKDRSKCYQLFDNSC